MVTPKIDRSLMLPKWIALRGDSLGTITRGRLSFRQTSAALLSKLFDMPVDIAEIVPILAGTTTIPSDGCDPLAIGAAKSPMA